VTSSRRILKRAPNVQEQCNFGRIKGKYAFVIISNVLNFVQIFTITAEIRVFQGYKRL
jgi:hypothetical protein